MTTELRHWIGMGGVPAHDNPHAYVWERRLHWIMVSMALLAFPSYYLDWLQGRGLLTGIGRELDWLIFIAFSLEMVWMLHLCQHKRAYLARNWLNVLIVAASALGVLGLPGDWLPLLRLLRITYVGLLFARLLSSLRSLLVTHAIPYVFALGMTTLVLAGAGFYWLEPTIHSFGEGLWLAYITAATVGYGDFVPTTTSSRLFAVILVIVGFTVFSIVTASISAFFVEEDERKLRKALHEDVLELRGEIAALRSELRQGGEAHGAEKKEAG